MKTPSKVKNTPILSGWATKEFSLDELKNYLEKYNPPILEISKDFVDGGVSIKKTYELIKEYKKYHSIVLSYAGTTDFVDCSGLSFEEYIKYLSIQSSQAKFLSSDFFRVLIGGNRNSSEKVLDRLSLFSKLISPAKILIEIHGGWESSLKNIKKIVEETDYGFVIDFQNILESNLSFNKLNSLIPKKRIIYYHCRNIDSYIENEKTLSEEKNWTPNKEDILWEPKLIKKKKILDLIKWT
jgi:hypothetical protein